MNIETGEVDVGSASIYYRALGQGEPVLVLHNFFASGETWMPFMVPLAEHRRVIVADLRGHGRSTNPGGAWSHRLSSEDMATLMTTLGHPVFDAIGTSSGAMTLLHMAVRQPGRLRAMVVISGTTHYTESVRAFQAAAFESRRIASARPFAQTDEQFDSLRSRFKAASENPDDMAFTPHHLATIQARALIVHGDRDSWFPPEIAMDMFRSIPNASLCIMPDIGHNPHLEGKGDAVIAIAREFLDKLAA